VFIDINVRYPVGSGWSHVIRAVVCHLEIGGPAAAGPNPHLRRDSINTIPRWGKTLVTKLQCPPQQIGLKQEELLITG